MNLFVSFTGFFIGIAVLVALATNYLVVGVTSACRGGSSSRSVSSMVELRQRLNAGSGTV